MRINVRVLQHPGSRRQKPNYVLFATGRHIYATVTGFALLYYPFGNGVFHLFVPTILTYLVMLQFQDSSATLSWLVNFTYLIGWCAYCPCMTQTSSTLIHVTFGLPFLRGAKLSLTHAASMLPCIQSEELKR